ncbi:MAG: hypothetical protein Rubg2KO_25150 [Rubricoccaceae bacterium]
MPLVYLDNCALQRPLDDRTQFRVLVEAEAIEAVLREIQKGTVELLNSDVLIAESRAAPDPTRCDFAAETLALASSTVQLTPNVEDRARPFRSAGMKAVDALHLASAVEGGVDFFCTTDDRFFRKAEAANTSGVRVVVPSDLAVALGL